MPKDNRDLSSDTATLLPSLGLGGTDRSMLDGAGLWLTGGAALLGWTALALLLTA